MAELDYQYIGKLVEQAKTGDSDSFAELYAATYQKQYYISYNYLGNGELAKSAVHDTYVSALKSLNQLNDPRLFVSWLNQINLRICFNLKNKADPDAEQADQSLTIGKQSYLLQQVLALPFSESQAIFMYYYNHMKISKIAEMMEIRKKSVKSFLASGRERLAQSPTV